MAFNRIPLKHRMLQGDRRSVVLVGDSDPEVRLMLSQLTPPDLYRLQEAATPTDLLDQLRFSEVALAVIDSSIMNHSNELQHYVALCSRRGMPVIVTAPSHTEDDEIMARGLGCVLYAPKPCSYWVLHQAVTEVLCVSAIGGK